MQNCRRDGAPSVRRSLCLLGLVLFTTQAFAFKPPPSATPGCGQDVADAREPWGYIAVADPGTKESPFAQALRHRGLLPIFVRSNHSTEPIADEVLSLFARFDDSAIEKRLQAGEFAEALAGLRMVQKKSTLPLTHVVAEGGNGAYFGEKLSAALALPGHDATFINSISVPTDMTARLRKHLERIRSDLRVMPQILTDDSHAVKEWLRDEFRGWHGVDGLIVSPGTRYSGSPHIYVHTDRELDLAMNHILGSSTPMGWNSNRVLVTPYIAGEEYSVNGAVLREGKKTFIRFTSVVNHVRPDRTDSGNETSLFDFEVPPGLLEAQTQVIEGLQYGIGPFHGQFKIGRDGVIHFVNHSLQFHGHGLTDLLDSCTDYGQVQAAADVYGNADRFKAEAKKSFNSTFRSVVVSIEVPRTERVLRANHRPLQQIERAISKHGHLYRIDKFAGHGETLQPSNGRLTVMARIEIRVPAGQLDREARIQEYLRMIEQIERSGAFFK